MPDPTGFLHHDRQLPRRRPVPVRLGDWLEVYPEADEALVRRQATRCMDCGVPFCQSLGFGCPLGNRIPDWNDLARTGRWEEAIDQLHATNNFPEFTGRLCPAPCESACVLGISQQPVTIKQIEVSIIDRAFADGTVVSSPPRHRSGRSVGVVGSGPAGLAAAQQLARAGHAVVVYERDDAIGGLLRHGIPDFKLEKRHIDRRVAQLEAEGVTFQTGVHIGVDVDAAVLRKRHDALVLACGALAGRDADVSGRDLAGVHLAMEHLVPANRVVAGKESVPVVDAAGKRVVIIGGGDTAADCLGVAHRQGAASVTQLDIYPEPPATRDEERDPWPTWPWILRTYPAHEEGGRREFAVAAQGFVGDGQVRAVRLADVRVTKQDGRRLVEVVAGTERDLVADLVLLAIGFEGTEDGPLLPQLGLRRNERGTVTTDAEWRAAPGVFVAGDMARGASLVVWAIAEGRSAAAAVDRYLRGDTTLPAPVPAGAGATH